MIGWRLAERWLESMPVSSKVAAVSELEGFDGREPLATVADVAGYLCVSEMTLYRLLEAEEGPPAYRIRRQVRFRWSEVDRWLERQRVSA